MKIKLYDIQADYIQLADALIDNGGELTPELETALQINKEQLEHKGQCYGFIIKDIEKEIEVIDAEIKRLQSMKKSRVNTVERLKETLQNAMNLFEITEIKSTLLKLSFRKSESVQVDENLLPDKYFKITKTPDKTAIKEALKNGEEVQGARMESNYNLQVR